MTKKYLIKIDKVKKCDKIFSLLVKKGDYEYRQTISKELYTVETNQIMMSFPIYMTSIYTSKLTDDEGCELLGKGCIFFKEVQKTRYC